MRLERLFTFQPHLCSQQLVAKVLCLNITLKELLLKRRLFFLVVSAYPYRIRNHFRKCDFVSFLNTNENLNKHMRYNGENLKAKL